MLSVDFVAAHAVYLPASTDTPHKGAEEALHRLAGRKTPVAGAREPQVLWGFDRTAFAGLAPAFLDKGSPLDASVVPMAIFRLLTKPAAAYAQPPVNGRRLVSHVAAFVDDEHEDPILAIGDLLLPTEAAGFELSVIWIDMADRDSACGHLAARYRHVAKDLGPRGPQKASRRMAWIGGPGEDPADASGWHEEIVAAAAARGYAVEIWAQPAARVRAVQIRMRSTDYALVAVWACDPPTVAVSAAIAAAVRGTPATIMERRLPDALLTAGWHLDTLIDTDEDDADEIVEVLAPASGEVRYYRKRTSVAGGKADALRRVEDCGKGGWQRTPKAIKALKGIEKLEGVSPKTLERCTACLGGGHWRARF